MVGNKETIPITNVNATRFWIGMKEANQFVAECVELMDDMVGGEIFVPKMASVKVMDVYSALTDNMSQFTIIGDRIGDKLHETLISKEEARHTIDVGDKYVIYPEEPRYSYSKPKGEPCEYRDGYTSENNKNFLGIQEIKETLAEN
jgi:UDP-N-acetylglucosamine 4,6-dehydratase